MTGGSYSAGGDEGGKGRKWLPLLLLLLALLIAAAIVLAMVLGGDDGDGERAQNPAPAQTQPAGGGDQGDAPPAGGGEGGTNIGELVVSGQSLFGLPAEESRQFVGQEAQGRNVLVQEVKGQNGFFVGPENAPNEWTFVEFGASIGGDEPGTIPEVGDRVDLAGPLEPTTELLDARQIDFSAERRQLLERRGVFVNADRVEPAQGP